MSGVRSGALGALLCLFVVTSGCVGFLTGSEPLVLTAEEAHVDEDALGRTEFELEDTQTAWINRTVEQAGQEREIRVQNHVAIYRRSLAIGGDGPTFGFFAVVATPQATVAGQALNPIGRMSPDQMVGQLAEGSAGVRGLEREDSRTLVVLGSEAEVVRFSGVVEEAGQEVPVYVEVTRVSDGEDFVVAIGGYPQATADQVRPGVTTLFEGIEH